MNNNIMEVILTETNLDRGIVLCLMRRRISTIGQLSNKSESELARIRSIGATKIIAIKEFLAGFGLRLVDLKELSKEELYESEVSKLNISHDIVANLENKKINKIGSLVSISENLLVKKGIIPSSSMKKLKQALEEVSLALYVDSSQEITLATEIQNIGLSPAVENALSRTDVFTVDDLLEFKEEKIKRLRAVGKTREEELQSKVAEIKMLFEIKKYQLLCEALYINNYVAYENLENKEAKTK